MHKRTFGVFLALGLILGLGAGNAVSAGAAPQKAVSANVAGVLPTKVLYIGEENMGSKKFFAKLPTAKSYAAMYGQSTGVRDQFVSPDRPSLPHYVVEGFGNATAFGINDDAAPKKHPLHGVTIFGNAVAHGLTAKDYVQDASGNCPLTDTGTYQKVRHDGGALAYDVDERTLCASIAVPMEPALSNDLAAGTLPNVGWIGLSVRDDGHAPGTPAQEDAELKSLLPQIMAGADYQAGRVVIVVSTDEASGSADPNVPVLVIHPSLLMSGAKNTEAMDQLGIYRMFMRYGGSTGLGDDALTGLHL